MTMTPMQQIWEQLKFVSGCSALTEDQIKTILPILVKRMRYLLQRSGIKRIKRLEDFDWKFNPHLLRSEIMGFSESCWNTEIKNLVLIGPSGVGKSHLASAICYKAIQKGIPTAFISCFDLVNKLKTSTSKHTCQSAFKNAPIISVKNAPPFPHDLRFSLLSCLMFF